MNQEFPLMRKATAVWLIENTSLTFSQIANFCGLHELEVQGIADGDVANGVIGQSPIFSGQLTFEEIKRCEKDKKSNLRINRSSSISTETGGKKSAKYTPIARRQDKPDGIAFIIKYYPELTNNQIKKLIGTTDTMIDSIKNRTHWNMKNIKPRDIVLLGLCSQSQLNEAINIAKSFKEKSEKHEAEILENSSKKANKSSTKEENKEKLKK
ncbi:MAG: DUF1013 domain-containing protein [Rickettsiales bacterium]|jgi:hypothetical protein|nr:DUF1013 domain-containing protein [Rickettsiales bacterium]